jgi:hypothetical protein
MKRPQIRPPNCTKLYKDGAEYMSAVFLLLTPPIRFDTQVSRAASNERCSSFCGLVDPSVPGEPKCFGLTDSLMYP